MDAEIMSTPSDIDPITFLQVEMDSNPTELALGSGIILSPAPTNLQRLQEVPGLFNSCDNLPGAEITPILASDDRTSSQLDEDSHSELNANYYYTSEDFEHPVEDEQITPTFDLLSGQIDDRRHVCNVCMCRFKRNGHLQRHMMTHTIEEVLQAHVTQQSYEDYDSNSLSSTKAKPVEDVRRHTCNVCHYRFKRADHLKRHMTRSHPEELALIAATEEIAKARQAAKAAREGKLAEGQQNNEENAAANQKVPSDERPFPCTMCDFKFKRKDHLQRHITLLHTGPIRMPRQPERAEEESLWWSSMRRFCCPVCGARFKRADHLKRHTAKHNTFNKEGSGDGESSSAQQENAVNAELLEDDGSNSNMEIEDGESSTKSSEKTVEEERRFECSVCHYRFKRRFHLMRHMIKHTEAQLVNLGLARSDINGKPEDVKDEDEIYFGKPPVKRSTPNVVFKCQVCDLEFKQPYRLKIHMARHSEQRTYACPLCSYKAKLACNLKKHMLTHTDEKPFACHLCDYRGKIACALKDHIALMHSDNKPFACQLCDFKAKVPSHLKKHMVCHQDEAPYQCTICDFRAKRAGNLKEHMATHTNEKRFTCSLCDYCTLRQRNLRKHMAVHFSAKPYICEICPYRAKLPHYLKAHMKTHASTKKPNLCPYCNFKCRQPKLLKKHILESHKENKQSSEMNTAEVEDDEEEAAEEDEDEDMEDQQDKDV